MSKQRNKATAPKEEVKPVVPVQPVEPIVPETPKPIEEAPQDHPRVEEQPKEEVKPVETPVIEKPVIETPKEVEPVVVSKQVDDVKTPIQDGTRLDQNVQAEPFDEESEKKAAHAEPEEHPEPVKNAIVNPNGLGNEWPRG